MNNSILRHDNDCRLCGSHSISTVFRLNDTPLEDQFVSQTQKTIAQPVYPLELALCDNCGYVHLPYIVNPVASYADYVYLSGTTVGLQNHYDHYAKEIVTDFCTPAGSLVVDLGSNDGSMLASFKRLDMKIVGVEPARSIAFQANESGLMTINDFFTDDVATHILASHGLASVVTANYMYANIDDVIGFTKYVVRLLAADGIFVVQTGYHPEQMKIKMFDYIYHEHFSYFTVEVLRDLFSTCGLELIDVQKLTPKGGSIRVVGQLKHGSRAVAVSVQRLINEEHQLGMREPGTYRQFALEVADSKHQLHDLLRVLKTNGKSIAGFGASHSTTTLIYHFEIAPFIDYLIDDNQLKQDHYSPGFHIPVYSSQKLYEDAPDYVLILAWQHRASVTARHQRYLTSGGHWIVPLPKLLVL